MNNNIIRVLHVVGKMHAGGMENLIMNIYRNINRNRIQFDFFTHYGQRALFDDEIESMGGRIYRFTVREDNNLFKYCFELQKFFNQHKEYKIIHAHLSSFGSIYFSYAKKAGVPVRIAHSHIDSYTKTLKGVIKHLMASHFKDNASHLFACSKRAGIYMFGSGCPFEVINNGIDTNKFRYSDNIREKIRKELGLENNFVVGHVGRFDIQKNHDFLIDIFKNIKTQKTNAKLMLVGDGVLKQKIENKVKKMNLEDSVMFMGVRKDVNYLYQAMDVFLFPSLFEGLPLTLIEAQTSGLPIVCSDAITDEAKILPLYKTISLKKSAKEWAEKLLDFKYDSPRNDSYKLVINKGFDIHDVTKKLEEKYIEFYRHNSE